MRLVILQVVFVATSAAAVWLCGLGSLDEPVTPDKAAYTRGYRAGLESRMRAEVGYHYQQGWADGWADQRRR